MGLEGQFAQQQWRAGHVRFGSKAEVKTLHFDVCFSPESDIERVFAHVR